MLLDYVTTYPNPKIRFHASDMILNVDSDAVYLVQTNARSRYSGYYYLGSPNSTNNTINGAVLAICRTIRNVVASAEEAENEVFFEIVSKLSQFGEDPMLWIIPNHQLQ